jgi:hypothetical protein
MPHLDTSLLAEQIAACRGKLGNIRQHGAWFTQLVMEGYHLNFWGHPTLEMPSIRTNPHTHDLGFTSRILLGEITNVRLSAEPHPEGAFMLHTVHEADGARDVVFKSTETRMHAYEDAVETMRAGDVYEMGLGDYHYTRCRVPTITYLKLWPDAPVDYNVLLPVGAGLNAKTVMRYVKDEDMPELWARIDAMLAMATV